jgi:nitrogen fixation protein FixH
MTVRIRKAPEFTGRQMLYVMLAFFGTVITVNMTMAVLAQTSWTGLVVENTYVASQEFNRKAEEGREQAALGWTGTLTIAGGAVQYILTDASGASVAPRSVTAIFRHPAYEQQDRVISLSRMANGTFESKETVRNGVWIVETDADVGRQRPYRQVRRIIIANGAIR